MDRIILSHNSALAALRALPPQTGRLTRVEEPLRLAEVRTSAKTLAAFHSEALGIGSPLHILSATSAARPRGAGVTSHRLGLYEIPAGLLWRLEPNVYVCGPELTFIQMAMQLGPVGRSVLGHELCGAYSQFARMISGFYDRPPLTTLADIRRVADLMGGVRGVGIARKALRWVREGSRSPMETVVSNMLFLPSSEGGYGFAAPTLNHRVTLDDAASAITGTSCCYVDMSWPELRLGIEYDSSAWHADAEKDRRRREALAHMDWSIYSIQLDDVRGFVSLDRMVRLFAERVPRARGWQPASTAEQDQLLRRLFTSTRCGLGLERMLFGAPVKHGSIGIHL
jgi:hypothetical protein